MTDLWFCQTFLSSNLAKLNRTPVHVANNHLIQEDLSTFFHQHPIAQTIGDSDETIEVLGVVFVDVTEPSDTI